MAVKKNKMIKKAGNMVAKTKNKQGRKARRTDAKKRFN
jgi:hypothetical protein